MSTISNTMFQLIGVPLALGCGRRGTEFAFDRLCSDGLDRIFSEDADNLLAEAITVPVQELHRNYLQNGLRNPQEVFAACRGVHHAVKTALDAGKFPFTIGGDHSIGLGTISAFAAHYGRENTAVIWVDAHTDIHSELTSVSHRIHGMPLGAAIGIGCAELESCGCGYPAPWVSGDQIYIVGARSIDAPEYTIMNEHGVNLYSIEELQRRGAQEIVWEILKRIENRHIYLSYDVDVLDGTRYRSTGLPVPNGIWEEESIALLTGFLNSGRVGGFDCVEYAPYQLPQYQDDLRMVQRILKSAVDAAAKVLRNVEILV